MKKIIYFFCGLITLVLCQILYAQSYNIPVGKFLILSVTNNYRESSGYCRGGSYTCRYVRYGANPIHLNEPFNDYYALDDSIYVCYIQPTKPGIYVLDRTHYFGLAGVIYNNCTTDPCTSLYTTEEHFVVNCNYDDNVHISLLNDFTMIIDTIRNTYIDRVFYLRIFNNKQVNVTLFNWHFEGDSSSSISTEIISSNALVDSIMIDSLSYINHVKLTVKCRVSPKSTLQKLRTNLSINMQFNGKDTVMFIPITISLNPRVFQNSALEISESDLLSIQSNPSHGTAHFSYQSPDVGELSLEIFNVIGELVSSSTKYVQAPNTSIPFSIDLPDGIYYIKVKSKSNLITKKLVVLR